MSLALTGLMVMLPQHTTSQNYAGMNKVSSKSCVGSSRHSPLHGTMPPSIWREWGKPYNLRMAHTKPTLEQGPTEY